MSDIPFHRTVRGARFFDHHVPLALEQLLPKLIRELERLNTNLERLQQQNERQRTADDE